MKLKMLGVATVTATLITLPAIGAGAAQWAHPKLHHWYAQQGGKQAIASLIADESAIGRAAGSGDSAQVGTDCQHLRNDVEIAQAGTPIPSRSLNRLWTAALGDYNAASTSCVNGVNDTSASEIDQASSDFASGTALIHHLAAQM